jgi:quinol-cytochrome oxidoreductase complex cytochrome b subunit
MMNPSKIVGWIGLAVAIVGAFVAIPYAALILLLAGLYAGTSVSGEQTVGTVIGAVALTTMSGNFDAIPAIGSYLHAIAGSIGAVAAGASLSSVLMGVWNRAKP